MHRPLNKFGASLIAPAPHGEASFIISAGFGCKSVRPPPAKLLLLLRKVVGAVEND